MARFDFPVISEGETEGDELPVGGSILRTETVFEDQSDWDFGDDRWTFVPGAQVGFVYLELARPSENRVVLTATFEFGGRESITLKGVVPWDDETGQPGGGRLAILGGTGKFQGRVGHVTLDVRNPKRWG